jgi:hypothetical protein
VTHSIFVLIWRNVKACLGHRHGFGKKNSGGSYHLGVASGVELTKYQNGNVHGHSLRCPNFHLVVLKNKGKDACMTIDDFLCFLTSCGVEKEWGGVRTTERDGLAT